MKTIISDIDQCILDFHTGLIDFINNENLPLNVKNAYDIYELHETDKDLFDTIIELFLQSNEFENLQYYRNSEKVIPILSKQYKIILLSATNESYRDKREKNLKKILPYISDLILNENKQKYLEQIRPDYYIEDLPKYIKQAYLYTEEIFVPSEIYNQNLSNVTYFSDWNELVYLI